MLSFEDVDGERSARLRGLLDVGWAVTIQRALEDGGSVCILEGHGARIVGRGPDADAAAAAALASLAERRRGEPATT